MPVTSASTWSQTGAVKKLREGAISAMMIDGAIGAPANEEEGCYTEGFSHFVTSVTAPVASGWSVRRVGLAPSGKRRLLTAHANSGPSPTVWKQA